MMPRIAWIEEEHATGDLAALYASWKQVNPQRDRIPGILKSFSSRPDVLRGIMDLSYSLHFQDGELTWHTKELLATYVSALNRCPYCTTSHAYFLEMQDARPAVVEALSQGDLAAAPVTAEERALLELAKVLTEHSHQCTDADVQRVRDAGWTEPQIAEAVYVIAMFGLFNRVANAFGLEPVNYREILGKAGFGGRFENPVGQKAGG